MGVTRREAQRTGNLIIIGFGALAVAAYFLGPYTNVGAADVVIVIASFVVMMTLFMRFIM